jgi:hypothetical protein
MQSCNKITACFPELNTLYVYKGNMKVSYNNYIVAIAIE